MLEELRWANLFDDPPGPVLLLGPTGVGKSSFARVLHANSPRRDRPFVQLNCANLPPERLDERLFGVRDRAYSGVARWVGVLEEADGGTLFLDEIGELSLVSQARLLTFLDTGCFRVAGDDRDTRTDVRIVSATNADPEALLSEGRMRLDFHARVSENEIVVPGLEDRAEDIPLLAQHLLDELQARSSFRLTFAPEALEALAARPWPTNVRGLGKEVRQAAKAAVRAGSASIDRAHLSPFEPRAGGPDLRGAKRDAERASIEAALVRAGGNRSEAARLLGIQRQHLYRRLRVLGIG